MYKLIKTRKSAKIHLLPYICLNAEGGQKFFFSTHLIHKDSNTAVKWAKSHQISRGRSGRPVVQTTLSTRNLGVAETSRPFGGGVTESYS